MKSRLLPAAWVLSFCAALMPFAAYEGQAFLLSVSLLVLALSFVLLKAPLPEHAAPLTAAFLLPVFGFWLVAFISMLTSQIPYTSYIYFAFFSALPLSLLCSITAPKKDEFFTPIAAVAGVIFAALSLFSLLQYFALKSWLVFDRAHWPFADPNALAAFLLPGFFLGAGAMIAGAKSWQRNSGLALAILTFGGLLTTGSRGGIVALAVAFLVFIALSRAQLRAHKKCALGLAGGAGVMAVLMNFAVHDWPGLTGRVAQTVSGVMPILWDRPSLWAAAGQLAREHFWTGTGIGTFYLYYPAIRDGDTMSAGRMVHNDPLQFAAEMGVFAPLLFYAFTGFAAFLTWKAFRMLEPGDTRRVHIAAPFCALGAIVLQAHVNFPFYVLPILMLAGALTGYWFRQVSAVLGPGFGKMPKIPLRHAEIIKIVMIMPLLLGGYGFLMLQGSVIVYDRGDARGQAGDIAGFVRDMNTADRMAMHKNAAAIVMAARTLHTSIADPTGQNAQENLLRAQALLDEAEKLNPKLVSVPYVRAQLARAAADRGLKGGGSEEDFLKAALAMNPLYYPARVDLADYYNRRGEKLKAYVVLSEGLKWQEAADVPPEFYQSLADAATAVGKLNVAGEAFKKLLRYRKQGEMP